MTEGRDADIAGRVRSVYEAFSRGDFDAVLAVAHPDIEYFPPGGQTPVRGIDGLRRWMQPSAFESQVLEATEVTVAGNKVLVLTHSWVKGAGSGIEMEADAWSVLTLTDEELVTRIETFFHYEEREARLAAGM